MRFRPVRPTLDEVRLRLEVRNHLARARERGDYEPVVNPIEAADRTFSEELASRGWVGMALPERFGGYGRTAVERWVVTEELFAAGAPIGGHWIADRQTAQLILRYGSPGLCHELLPAIAAGRCWFAIGMSEPDAGSDLASVRTRADRHDGGWIVNGTKTWTTGAQNADYMLTLCRTGAPGLPNHQALSQLVVDLGAPGVEVRPIEYMDGSPLFNEVVLNEVFVPDEFFVGEPGAGWGQVTTELALERAGPDRYMAIVPMLQRVVTARPDLLRDHPSEIGRLLSRLCAVRQLSLTLATMLDEAESPALGAALVKDLATSLEVDIVDTLRRILGEPLRVEGPDDLAIRYLARATMLAPIHTLGGGTTEILRVVAAKALLAEHGL